MIVVGVALLAFVPAAGATSHQPVLFARAARALVDDGGAQGPPAATTSGSTMSVSYAVDFASLLLLGPHETMLVAAAARSASAI